jgi:hypothetical protein
MSRPFPLALVIFGVLAVGSNAFAADTPNDPQAVFNFEKELDLLRSGDTSVDFTKLRLGLAQTKAFSPYAIKERELRNNVVAAVNAGDCEKALDVVDQIFEINYLYPDAHMGAMICHDALGNSREAAFHRAVLGELFRSICGPEEGYNESNPCTVIATYEEYFVLQSLGLTFKSQGLISYAGKPCDILTAVDPESGKEVTIFFDVSLAFNRMAD